MLTEDHHVHLYGCLTAEELWEIGKDRYRFCEAGLNWYAQTYQEAFGWRPNFLAYWQESDGIEKLKQDFLIQDKVSFDQFQAKFNLIIALCQIQPEVCSVPEKILRRVAGAGVREFSARTLIPLRFSREEAGVYLQTLTGLVKQLNRELPMQTSLVFSLFRDKDLALNHYLWIREFIETYPDLGSCITGLDFAGMEILNPPCDNFDLCRRLDYDNKSRRKLLLHYHVGESFHTLKTGIRWIYEAYSLLKVDRLSHALALGLPPEIVKEGIDSSTESEVTKQWLKTNQGLFAEHGCADPEDTRSLQIAVASILKQDGAVIESCPTSNIRIGGIDDLAHHPLLFFKNAGLNVMLGTDDPGIFNIDWLSEYALTNAILGAQNHAR